ncbi:hypothetical protein BSAF29S_02302 [Bacillus safensis subsp. safensis]
MTNHKVFVAKGAGGWGEGLELEPTGKRRKVVSITGGGIHPVARKIAEMTEKLLIARALMNDPQLLILDEPVTGLDFLAREQVLETISFIAAKPDAPTLLYTTHHAEEILPVFQHTLLLKDGSVFDQGETKEMMTSGLLFFFECPVDVMWRNGRPHLSKL